MKHFEDVFPTLKLDGHLYNTIRDAMVEKITTDRTGTRLKVYTVMKALIPRKELAEIEREIKDQLFKRSAVTLEIRERFELSGDFSPENIWTSYGNSIIEEISSLNVLNGQIIRECKISFVENSKMQIVFPDSLVSRKKEKEITALIRDIFDKRCGMPVEIITGYRETEKSDMEKLKEMELANEVRQALYRMSRINGDTDTDTDDAGSEASDIDGKSAESEVSNNNEDGSNTALSGHGDSDSSGKNPSASGRKSGRNQNGPARRRPIRDGDDPNLIYGKDFSGEDIPLSQVESVMGEIICKGQIFDRDIREIRNEKSIIIFSITDFTSSITVKMFVHNEDLPEIIGPLSDGAFIRICGMTNIDKYDGELGLSDIRGIRKISDFRDKRIDTADEKRVELHCHTKMSDMDGLSSAEDIVNTAISMGMNSVAITDHGVVHAFPEAFHTLQQARAKAKDKGENLDFKVIYGMEGYIVDDLVDLVVNSRGQSLDGEFVVFDLETTGFNSIHDKIIEIGAVKIINGEITDRFSTYVNPKIPIPFNITELTTITDEMVRDSGTIEEILPEFLEFAGDAVLVAHNAGFDAGFINQNCRYQGITPDFTYVDTVSLARILLPSLSKYKLDAVAKHLGISLENHHRAVDDAECTAYIWLKFRELLVRDSIHDLDGLNKMRSMTPEMIRKLPMHHIILLAKNEEGRKNLYRLVSMSHLTYFGKRPRLPKSEIIKYREGLILGSACVMGELYDAILSERSEEIIRNIVEFYDYLEIQPLANNAFLMTDSKYPRINTREDLININLRIIELGEMYNKPVVATCDVHFLNPEDEISRRVILSGNNFKDCDKPEPLYFRTTDEMLKEFNYLEDSKAYEVVIRNSRKIADMIEYIEPVRPDKCPPVIPDSDKILTECCYERAHEIYGENLPPQVEARLEKELNSIISNGFAVMYIIARKLVLKSNEDGYLVGSRGSVGSSFVANMSGITEVNSLSPHYYCPNCHFYDFDSEEVKKYAEGCGWDMPDRICPNCGMPLKKTGFNIPFETFLGFKGNKEPDIDLNFSGDYQAKAHKYTEVIFGQGQTFKAGTIGTVADKTAFGFVMHYFEERGIHMRRCELKRIAEKCTGVRRSTGQHPGGIVVLPHGEEIHTFTPVQHPANDMTTDIITTHFDYHSIDHNLLKLDILGHDDPTMIRRLEDLTGINCREIPLDDKGVLSLFADTSALGIIPEDIHGCKLGCLGIPEFGTDFVIQMLIDTKPKTFSDLVRISGLSHGTNVWVGNAQTLVQEGTTDLAGAICTRDDIMTYLIHKGMESELSFKTMESVRKGKGLKPEMEEAMRSVGVPDWYIWSCKRISYMFPKAHAVAYVTMAFRIAYCKIYYPLAYYAAYFAIRASAFSYELMCRGKEALRANFDRLLALEHPSQKEQELIKDMKIVEEMYARGFEFMPIDIYRARARDFQIIDGKIMPSFSSIDGMGDKAAESLEEAAAGGTFLSKNDLRERSHISKTTIDKMAELGLLGDLPESDQLSLFDFM